MEASTLTTASHGGLLGRRSPLLKLQGDEKLVAQIRQGNEHAFDVLFERYHSRLLAFCRHMLRSTEDAEDVLQEVFVKAHAALLADDRPINARPWLYRIARNRCLNHLRKPVADGQDSMDILVGEGGVTTADRVQKREDFRQLVADVQDLPETQRTALLLREIDALSYEEIAQTMDTTVPAVKSLLVRARMSLAEATQSRQLTCGEVQLELAEAAEGLRKATGPVRHHVKRCEPCREFRSELRSNAKALAAIAPLGPLALLHKLIIGKLGLSGSSSAAAGGSAAAGTGAAAGTSAAAGGVAAGGAAAGGAAAGGAAAAGGSAAAFGGAAAAGAGGLGGAIGAKAAATAATAALLTAGAVEVRQIYSGQKSTDPGREAAAQSAPPTRGSGVAPAEAKVVKVGSATATGTAQAKPVQPVEEPAAPPAASDQPAPAEPTAAAKPPAPVDQAEEGVVGPTAGDDGAGVGAEGSGTADPVVVTEPATAEPDPSASPPPPAAPVIGDPAPPPASAEPAPPETAPAPYAPAG